MKKKLLFLVLTIAFLSCNNQQKVDLIVINSNSYTVNTNFDKREAFAVKDGKFVAVGTSREIKEKYISENIINAKEQTIVPGLIDAHCHFYGLGLQQQKVDFRGKPHCHQPGC